MSDDIVTRLRAGCLDELSGELLMDSAADEIERLRTENESLRNGLNFWAIKYMKDKTDGVQS